jgi:hypothetical protein
MWGMQILQEQISVLLSPLACMAQASLGLTFSLHAGRSCKKQRPYL